MISSIIVVVIAITIGVAIHEASHALALRTFGIPISHAGVGMPIKPMLTIPPKGRRKFALTFSPWIVGAYVMADERYTKEIDELNYNDKAWYLNAGVISNIILGSAVLSIVYLIDGRFVRAIITALLTVLTWYGRRIIAAYVLPALALPILVWFAFNTLDLWSSGDTDLGYAGLPNLVEPGLIGLVKFIALVSLALAFFNSLPLYGLDNGKVVELLLSRWIRHNIRVAYQYTGMAILAVLLIGAMASDIWKLIILVTPLG